MRSTAVPCKYIYHDNYVINVHCGEHQQPNVFLGSGKNIALICLMNDSSLYHLISDSFAAWSQHQSEFNLLTFVMHFRKNNQDHLSREHRAIFLCIDETEQSLQVVNFSMPRLLLKGQEHNVISMAEEEGSLANPDAMFRVYACPLTEVSSIIATDSNNLLHLAQQHFHHISSKNHIEDLMSAEGSQGSYAYINLFFATPPQLEGEFTQSQFDLDAICQLEERFQKTLDNLDIDKAAVERANITFHEIFFNAFEHGVLHIGRERKDTLIREGRYETVLQELGATAEGSIQVQIHRLPPHQLLRITIADSGPGFDFRPFLSQLHCSVDTYRGRGICFIRNYTDGIYYRCHGNKVSFHICTATASCTRTNTQESSASADTNPAWDDISILVVDDDPYVLDMYSLLLRRTTSKVHTACDGKEGLEKYHQLRPDVIISDIQMPHITGLEMVRHIRENDLSTPIILLTAYSDRDHILEAIETGANRFITKPLEVHKLRNHLEYYVTQIRTKRELDAKRQEEQHQREQAFFELNAKRLHDEQQQRETFAKEQLIIRNDSAKLIHIRAETYYKPQEILSGDIYGICHINADEDLFYIIDSMGKGLSASVTSILCASWLNNHIQNIIDQSAFFDIDDTANRFANYIRQYLIDSEMLSFCLANIDNRNGTINYISCGMYPLLIKDLSTASHTIISLKGNHPPFFRYSAPLQKSTAPLPQYYALLMYSDALCENDSFGTKQLQESFRQHHSLEPIVSAFYQAIGLNNQETADDDLSAILVVKEP